MAAYVIAEIDVTDPKGYEEYRRMGRRRLRPKKRARGASPFLTHDGGIQLYVSSKRM